MGDRKMGDRKMGDRKMGDRKMGDKTKGFIFLSPYFPVRGLSISR